MSTHTWDSVKKYFDELNERRHRAGEVAKTGWDDITKKHKTPEEAMLDLDAKAKELDEQIKAKQTRRA